MIVLQALYFMVPAYVANMAPVFAAKIFGGVFNAPVDFGMKFRGKPVLGSHKTFRGFIAGIVIAVAFIYLQLYFYQFPFWNSVSILNYNEINLLLYGFLFGFGALLGDLVKSFFKRQLGVRPGKSWIPWDQVDFLVGALVLVGFAYIPKGSIVLLILIISPFLHIAANQIGYYLKVKKTKW